MSETARDGRDDTDDDVGRGGDRRSTTRRRSANAAAASCWSRRSSGSPITSATWPMILPRTATTCSPRRCSIASIPASRRRTAAPDFGRAVELARELHPFERSLADVQTCIDALGREGPVFVVGYCYGGSVAWAAATRLDGVAAASAYYGVDDPQVRRGGRAPRSRRRPLRSPRRRHPDGGGRGGRSRSGSRTRPSTSTRRGTASTRIGVRTITSPPPNWRRSARWHCSARAAADLSVRRPRLSPQASPAPAGPAPSPDRSGGTASAAAARRRRDRRPHNP